VIGIVELDGVLVVETDASLFKRNAVFSDIGFFFLLIPFELKKIITLKSAAWRKPGLTAFAMLLCGSAIEATIGVFFDNFEKLIQTIYFWHWFISVPF